MNAQEEMELEVIKKALVSRDILPENISNTQYDSLVVSRNIDGSGFMTIFREDPALHILSNASNEDLSPCEATLDGNSNPVGFVVMIKNGRIVWLEGFSYDGEAWPKKLRSYNIHEI